MDQATKELYISRIITGFFRCKIDGKVFLLKQPDRHTRHISQEIYIDELREAELQGLYNEEELKNFLYQNNIWSDKKESDLKQLLKDIEEYKVKLFQSYFKSEEKKTLKKLLSIAKNKFNEMYLEKSSYNHISAIGVATMAKIRYLVGKSLTYENGDRVWENDDFWKSGDPLLENATNVHTENKISDSDFREIARTEPWRTIWACRKCERELFGVPAVDLTEEQKTLVIWSSMYDSIYEHHQSPSQDVINDDDMTDGWLILQNRQRDKDKRKLEADDLLSNEKIKNSGEIFLIAETKEDAEKVNDLNDQSAKMIKKQRLDYLNKHGEVDEANMPDTKMDIQMQANRARG